MTLRFAFMLLHEHPYGREMLRILDAHGFQPGLLIEERSEVASEERQKFLARIAGEEIPPPIADLVDAGGVPRREVDDHNSSECQSLLEAYEPEVIVLGGTRIIQPHILALPHRGTVNAHPGLLPWLRGSSSVAWALYKDLAVGSTVHFVESGIDTGPIITRRALPIHRGTTYQQIVRQMLSLSGELMAETLAQFEAGHVSADDQVPGEGETLSVIPPELLETAKANLASGRYSHFVD